MCILPWVGKIFWSRKWQPTPVFLPEKFHWQRNLAGYCPRGHKVRHNWATENTQRYFTPKRSYQLDAISRKHTFLKPWLSPDTLENEFLPSEYKFWRVVKTGEVRWMDTRANSTKGWNWHYPSQSILLGPTGGQGSWEGNRVFVPKCKLVWYFLKNSFLLFPPNLNAFPRIRPCIRIKFPTSFGWY